MTIRHTLKEEPTQKAPASYIPIVMHKNREAESMISHLEPTEE